MTISLNFVIAITGAREVGFSHYKQWVTGDLSAKRGAPSDALRQPFRPDRQGN